MFHVERVRRDASESMARFTWNIPACIEGRAARGEPSAASSTSRGASTGSGVNRRVVESLVKCGAFNSLHENRSAVWAGLDVALEAGASAQRDREIGQESLFAGLGDGALAEPALPDSPEWTERQRLEGEKEVLGFYVSGHPLSSVARRLERFVDTKSAGTENKQGREVRVGGILTALRETRTRRGGSLMGFGYPGGSWRAASTW